MFNMRQVGTNDGFMTLEYIATATYYIILNIVFKCKYFLNLLRGQYLIIVIQNSIC